MNLEEKVNADIKQAMLSKDEASLRGVRAIKSAILLAKTEKGGSKELTEEVEMKLLQKLVKQRKDSLEIYEKEQRLDLANKEREEIEVIERYLPKQISGEELRAEVQRIVEDVGAKSQQDMGRVMAAAMKQLGGKADGKSISAMVKEMLVGK